MGAGSFPCQYTEKEKEAKGEGASRASREWKRGAVAMPSDIELLRSFYKHRTSDGVLFYLNHAGVRKVSRWGFAYIRGYLRD
jgi:hypothetical protein